MSPLQRTGTHLVKQISTQRTALDTRLCTSVFCLPKRPNVFRCFVKTKTLVCHFTLFSFAGKFGGEERAIRSTNKLFSATHYSVHQLSRLRKYANNIYTYAWMILHPCFPYAFGASKRLDRMNE
jgi:hypothetical protein